MSIRSNLGQWELDLESKRDSWWYQLNLVSSYAERRVDLLNSLVTWVTMFRISLFKLFELFSYDKTKTFFLTNTYYTRFSCSGPGSPLLTHLLALPIYYVVFPNIPCCFMPTGYTLCLHCHSLFYSLLLSYLFLFTIRNTSWEYLLKSLHWNRSLI